MPKNTPEELSAAYRTIAIGALDQLIALLESDVAMLATGCSHSEESRAQVLALKAKALADNKEVRRQFDLPNG